MELKIASADKEKIDLFLTILKFLQHNEDLLVFPALMQLLAALGLQEIASSKSGFTRDQLQLWTDENNRPFGNVNPEIGESFENQVIEAIASVLTEAKNLPVANVR